MNQSTAKLKKFLLNHWLILILGIVFLLRLPSLFEPFTYGDEGVYLTLGQAIRRGLVLYRDIYDNKPPLLYLLAAFAGNFSTYRLILFIWSFITLLAFYKLVQSVFLKNDSAIAISTSAFAVLTNLHTFEGNIANAENFMLLPTIVAFYLIFKVFSGTFTPTRSILGAGFLFGLATLFKVPAAFDFTAALALFFLVPVIEKPKNYKLYIINSTFLLLGFLTPILITIVYFASQNALSQYFTAAFSQNLPYLSSWTPGKTKVLNLPWPLLGRALLVGALLILIFLYRKKISTILKLILIWFAFSLFAALLSSRPYPHYLIQILPAFSLAFGFFAKKATQIIPLALLAIFVYIFLAFRFWYYPNLPYYLTFYRWSDQTQAIYKTAQFLRTHLQKEEKVFIWGNEPFIYALAERLPTGRYTTAYQIIDFNGYQQTLNALTKNPPRYIIVTGTENRPFPQLFNFIQEFYLPDIRFDSIKIFHRFKGDIIKSTTNPYEKSVAPGCSL